MTDRVTGETFIRGAAAQLTALNEQLEIEIAALKEKNDLLHAQVAFFQKLYQVRLDLPSCFMSHAAWISLLTGVCLQMDGFDTTTLGSVGDLSLRPKP